MSKPFNIGDVVECQEDSFFKGINIILEVSRCQGGWHYSSNRGAWLYHSTLKLIKEADEETSEHAGELLEAVNEYESYDEPELKIKIDELENKILERAKCQSK